MSGVNNVPCINILDKVESIVTQNSIILTELEDYRHEYLRLWMSDAFNDQKFTILNKWSQQWSLYQHSRQSEVTDILKSITFTELEDCRHEYLRLWMSDVFHDQKFTSLNKWSQQRYQYQHSWRSEVTYILKSRILNEWSQQCSLYQHSRQSGVNNNSKFYNIDWVRGLKARISTIMNEWCLQWPKVYNSE